MDSKICVLGLGYIGLPTASILAINGYWVIGVDVNPTVVETIDKGSVHIREPGLETMVKAATFSGRLVARMAPETSDVFVIAVPTPVHENKQADLSAVVAASVAIVPWLREGNLVILESTVVPGTTCDIVAPILERSGLHAGTDFHLAHAPERVLPGNIMNELVQNDRVIGGIDKESADRAQQIYRKFVNGNIYLTDSTTAELVKLVENTYRDVNLALANELARIANKLDINVWEVIDLANKHPRVNVLQPGPGVGGHCIPVDPWFIVDRLPEESQLIQLARNTNDHMPNYVFEKISELIKDIQDPIVTILGLAYKANVDDTRESPSYVIVDLLERAGCQVRVHDPYVCPDISLDEVVSGSDCLVMLVDHRDYDELEPESLALQMRTKKIYTARRLTSLEHWEQAGFFAKQLGNGFRDGFSQIRAERKNSNE